MEGGGMPRIAIVSFMAFMVVFSAVVYPSDSGKSLSNDTNSQFRRYSVAEKDTLEISLPRSWSDSVKFAGTDMKEIFIEKTGDTAFALHLALQGNNGPLINRPGVVKTYLQNLKRIKEPRVDANFRDIRGPEMTGVYYSFEIPPRDGTTVRYVARGAAKIGPLLLTFTILTESPQSSSLVSALDMLRAARYIAKP
jgi:hypothetical protein